MPSLTTEQYNTLKERGMSDQTIKQVAESRGYTLPGGDTGVKGIATGFAKGGLEIARGTSQALQGLGQRALAAVTPKSLGEVRDTTGFKSLDDNTPEGQGVSELLKAKTGEEKIGKVAANVASFFAPSSKATQIGGRVLKGAGQGVSKLGIGISAKEAPLIQSYRARHPISQRITAAIEGKTLSGKPLTNRETALNKNIFGTESMIGIQSKRGATNLWKKVVSPSLKNSNVKIKMTDFIDDIGKQVNKTTDLSRKRQLQEALEAFADDYKDVGEISLEQLQKFKEGWATFIPDKVYKGKPIAGIFREIQNIAAQLSRNKIYNAVGDEVKAAYFDYGNLKSLQALGEKALTGGKFKGGAGTFISGVLDAALTPIASTGGLALYKTGKGLEFIGTKGLNTVKQIFGL